MIGILGGTFDPIHFGHLRPALELLQDTGMREVRLIPACVPPHRDPPHASAEHRRQMVELAVADQPGLAVDERELHRTGPSYMVDTLGSLREELGDTPLVLILGMDAFLGLPRWDRWERLVELAHLLIMRRPGWEPPADGLLGTLIREREVADAQGLAARPAGGILFRSVTQLEISATQIRDLLAQGLSPRYLLPDPVLAFLGRERIYG